MFQETQTSVARARPAPIWSGFPAASFRMGSDKHYVEEAPVHRVTVDAFWIVHTPVTNREFRDFVSATGHVTFAEIAPIERGVPRMTQPDASNKSDGGYHA